MNTKIVSVTKDTDGFHIDVGGLPYLPVELAEQIANEVVANAMKDIEMGIKKDIEDIIAEAKMWKTICYISLILFGIILLLLGGK